MESRVTFVFSKVRLTHRPLSCMQITKVGGGGGRLRTFLFPSFPFLGEGRGGGKADRALANHPLGVFLYTSHSITLSAVH